MSSFNSDLIRNDTNLDVINAYDVPLNTPPPNIIASSPCGRVLAIATPIGITFYWTDTMNNNNNNNRDKNNNNIHSVRLPERISSMKFFPVINNNNMARLYVATVERVFIWEVSTLSKTINEEKRNDSDLGPRTTILEQYIEKDAMAISAKANYFAVSLGKNVVIYDTETHAPTCRLEGHFGTINAMTFFTPHADHVLITVGEDRTFKIWDCKEQSLLYQSSVISSSPFLTVAIDPIFPHIALGTVDGSLRIYRYHHNQGIALNKNNKKNQNRYDVDNISMNNIGNFFCTEIHYDNMGRLLDRRDHLRHGNTSIYNDEEEDDNRQYNNKNNNMTRNDVSINALQENYDNNNLVGNATPIVPVVSSLPRWAQGNNNNQNNGNNKRFGEDDRQKNDNGNMIKPSRSIVFLTYRSMDASIVNDKEKEDDENDDDDEEEDDDIFNIGSNTSKQNIPNILNSQTSYLIIGTAKALLHLNTNTYMTDSVLEFDHPSILNVQGQPGTSRKRNNYSALSPLAAKAMQIATSRHPLKGLPGIQLSTGCMFECVDHISTINNSKASSSSMYMFIGNMFKGNCNIIQLPSNEHVINLTNMKKKKNQIGKRRPSRYSKANGNSLLSPSTLLSTSDLKSISINNEDEDINNNVELLSENEDDEISSISIFPSAAAASMLHKASPLNYGYKQIIKTSSNNNNNGKSSGGRRMMGSTTGARNGKSSRNNSSSNNSKMKNKPVTFHTRIRSSGYGKAPKYTKLFTKNSGKKKKRTSGVVNLMGESSVYPTDEELIYSKGIIKPNQLSNTPLSDMKFTSDARSLLIGFADGTATSTRLPFNKDKSPARYIGHEGPITSVDWNHNQQLKLLLTSSEDGTVKVWKRNRPAAVLNINNQAPSSSSSRSNNHSSSNNHHHTNGTMPNTSSSSVIPSSVKVAKFFYMDKFIFLAKSNRLEMYKYAVDHLTDEKNDLRRLQNHSKCKLIKTWNEPSQTINSIALQNNFFSHIVITAGTNRSVHIYDMNKGQRIKTMEQAHGRSVHSVVLPTLSDYTSLPNNIYDIFLSGATDGTVKLWDLRSSCKCIRTFQEHTNRVQKIGMAFSPCMRYIACGSENKCTYVYDLRNGQVFDKIRGGHQDTISCCIFNPKYPQLVTGGAVSEISTCIYYVHISSHLTCIYIYIFYYFTGW